MDNPNPVSRSSLSRRRFDQEVEKQAFKNWRLRETDRRIRDWYAAHAELGYSGKTEPIFFSDPRFQEVARRAYEIHEMKKQSRAERDWFDAEGYISKFCFIGDKP